MEASMPLVAGDLILVPVKVDSGPFSVECLISFNSLDGPISGFIRADQIVRRRERTFIRARVLKLTKDSITVQLHGSFFTTTGLAHIRRDTPYLEAA
jgi:hypothetical protein